MAQSILQLVQEFCGKKTLPVPTAVIGNTDTGVVQIRYILAEVLRELSEYRWQEQKVEKTFTSIAAEDQGLLTTVIGADFRGIVPGTFWDQTLKRPVFGPVSDTMWSNLQTFPASGPIYQWKVFGNHLNIFPAPEAGHTMYLIYESTYPLLDGTTAIPAMTADTNTFLLPELLVHKGLDWKWKKQKGEAWETDYSEYMNFLPKKLTDTNMPVYHLDGEKFKLTPGIWVPAGDWPH